MSLILRTFCQHRTVGTFSELIIDWEGLKTRLFTVEPDWNANAVGASCIPRGTYPVRPDRFERGGYDTWEIDNVPGRSEVKFHKGNLASESRACPLVGMELGMVDGIWAVIDSAGAFDVFMEEMARAKPKSVVVTGRRA